MMAGLYDKNYVDIMDIFDRKDQENSDWQMMDKLKE